MPLLSPISHSLSETENLAKSFLTALKPNDQAATVVGLVGDLGSGKTTFVQVLARELGIKGPVTSPTFVLEKVYKINHGEKRWQHLIHIDAYRLESPDELNHLGWPEIVIDPVNLILIEWADRVANLLPPEAITVAFKYLDDSRREITWPNQ